MFGQREQLMTMPRAWCLGPLAQCGERLLDRFHHPPVWVLALFRPSMRCSKTFQDGYPRIVVDILHAHINLLERYEIDAIARSLLGFHYGTSPGAMESRYRGMM